MPVVASELVMSESHWNPTLTDRQRVLLHTQPLMLMRYLWLQRNDERPAYDPLFLCMKLFEFIIDQSGFGNDVIRDAAERELSPLLKAVDAAEAVEPDKKRHHRVLDRLFGNLLNDAKRGESFSINYTDFDEVGRSSQKAVTFKLLKEVHGYTGEIALELSSEAINLFLNALSLDIESEQIANEAVVQFQLERGNFDKARSSAETARARSVQYEQNVHRLLEQVKRDIRQVNWRDEVHEIIVAANDHIDVRLRIEGDIVRSANEKLDALAEDDENRGSLSEIIRLMDDCASRHHRLSKRLMTARGEFIDQQARQSFVDGDFTQQIELRDEVLRPLLNLPTSDVISLCDRVGHSLLAVRAPNLLSLRELVTWQLQPKRETSTGETPIEELELVETDAELTRFSDDVLADCQKVFSELDRSTRLSVLLSRLEADGCPTPVQDAVTLQVLERFDTEDEDRGPSLGVELTGEGELDMPRCAGDELFIVPLE